MFMRKMLFLSVLMFSVTLYPGISFSKAHNFDVVYYRVISLSDEQNSETSAAGFPCSLQSSRQCRLGQGSFEKQGDKYEGK